MAMDAQTEARIAALEEAFRAVMVVMTEQLDLDRVIVGLKRQHDAYERTAPAVAQHIYEVGRVLTQISAIREQRGKDEH